MEEVYLINEISKMFGISADTIRYYEKMGLLHSSRNQTNHYRIYDLNAVNNLSTVMMLRSFGMPMKLIREIFGHPTLDKLNSSLQDTQQLVQAQIEDLYSSQRRLLDFYSHLGRVSMQVGQIMIRQSPRFWFLQTSHEPNLTKLIREYTSTADPDRPAAIISFSIAPEDFLARRLKYSKYGLIFEQPYFCRTAEFQTVEFPARQCVYYIFFGQGKDQVQNALNHILDWIESHHFTVTGEPMSQYILGTPEYSLLEYWIPVK